MIAPSSLMTLPSHRGSVRRLVAVRAAGRTRSGRCLGVSRWTGRTTPWVGAREAGDGDGRSPLNDSLGVFTQEGVVRQDYHEEEITYVDQT